MKLSFHHVAAVASLAAAFIAVPASAAQISSSFTQSGAEIGTKEHVVGTIGTFTFADPASNLGSITGLELTLTLKDGDTDGNADVRDFDYGDLTLGLDGFDTGLTLNGFSNGAIVTKLFSLDTVLNAKEIYNALLDGSLVATILDVDTDDRSSDANSDPYANRKNMITVSAITDKGDAIAKLTLIGGDPVDRLSAAAAVPEPASLALTALGLAGLALSRRRRTN